MHLRRDDGALLLVGVGQPVRGGRPRLPHLPVLASERLEHEHVVRILVHREPSGAGFDMPACEDCDDLVQRNLSEQVAEENEEEDRPEERHEAIGVFL